MTQRSLLRTLALWLSPLLVLGISIYAVWTAYADRQDRRQSDHLAREIALYKEVRQRIVESYVGETSAEELMIAALRGLTDPLDQHSVFQDATAYADFRRATEGVIQGGIGVRIVPSELGVRVMTPLWDSPALAAGVLPNDLITSIDGKQTSGLSTMEIAGLLGGDVGSPVQLRIARAGGEVQLSVLRDDVRLTSVEQIGFVDATIGYLHLASFQEDSASEVADAVLRLRGLGMSSLILDLRSNPGGRLSAATELADLFLEEGIIVATQGRLAGQHHVAHAEAKGTLPDFPLVVLVNGDSASASEVLAGALQDHRRALVVGTRTWGKGSVQEVFPVDNDRMALKLTTKRYLTPSGRSLHRESDSVVWGICPDVHIALSEEEQEAIENAWSAAEVLHGVTSERPLVTPRRDRQLDGATAVLQGETVCGDAVTYR